MLKTEIVIERLTQSHHALSYSSAALSQERVAKLLHEIFKLIFIDYLEVKKNKQAILQEMSILLKRIKTKLSAYINASFSLSGSEYINLHGEKLVETLINQLPELRTRLDLDINASYENDPSCQSRHEAVLCFPAIVALFHYRFAHELYRLNIPLLPRMITEIAHERTGIDIHPAARLGESLFIDHGTGVVIGETAVIGSGVKIYQGVVLGAKSFLYDNQGQLQRNYDRHPLIGDNVTLYSGAVVLGRIVVGAGSVIGSQVRVTESLPTHSRVYSSAQGALGPLSPRVGSL